MTDIESRARAQQDDLIHGGIDCGFQAAHGREEEGSARQNRGENCPLRRVAKCKTAYEQLGANLSPRQLHPPEKPIAVRNWPGGQAIGARQEPGIDRWSLSSHA